jgi:hypothetical protein
VEENARAARHEFVYREIESPEQLGEKGMVVMQRFLADFPGGLREGRYLTSTSVTVRSTWRSAPTFSSPTPANSPSTSTPPR